MLFVTTPPQNLPALLYSDRCQFLCCARLADARLTTEHHYAALPCQRVLQGRPQDIYLMLPAYENTWRSALILLTGTTTALHGQYLDAPFHSPSVHAECSGNGSDALALLTQMFNPLQKEFSVHSASYLAVRAEHYTRVSEIQPA
jgi:hypothetical protein